MGKTPCCDQSGLKKGPWAVEEDMKLIDYIQKHGYGRWRTLPKNAGLLRCGKSCRLRWTNYLRPDIKRGKFSKEEEDNIIYLHTMLGNKWSAIAARLPGRTDNEVKNYWNTHIRKRLQRMGVDPPNHPLPLNHLSPISHSPPPPPPLFPIPFSEESQPPQFLNITNPPPSLNLLESNEYLHASVQYSNPPLSFHHDLQQYYSHLQSCCYGDELGGSSISSSVMFSDSPSFFGPSEELMGGGALVELNYYGG